MKTIIACLLFVLGVSAAERPSGQKRRSTTGAAPKASSASNPPRAVAVVSVPKDAVPAEPGIWNWTDPAGRKWILRQTPFGISKFEDRVEKRSESATAKVAEITGAVERGDEVAFERPGPFGTYHWQRKKTELDDVEKAAWERARAKTQAGGKTGRE